ncbi:EF-hand domain-containing protein 1-like isoform X2 [Adelges cooleyi]|uniref:EF-hand domain-containing protein 1-like isoform X2 n=1 Tax=Adelges cooleyi TaxID=133065 RepID=UPI0021803118|nr:EF-hand domain-containing protein 1-like isoform X2 [Adelges cooleyi]
MDGLPFIPGFRFNDITKRNYHLSAQFKWKNGYAIPKEKCIGIGRGLLDVDSVQHTRTLGSTGYDPTLTYGQVKQPPKPTFQSHFVLYDGKCLSFNGYTKQSNPESPLDSYRVRRVKITYYLVDDTISVVEPVVENAGYPQGCLLKRGSIPKPSRKNKTWHWSDFNNGVELTFHGGIVMTPDEPVPEDPYTVKRSQQLQQEMKAKEAAMATKLTEFASDQVEHGKFKRFLEYDGKVLRFYAAWDDNGSEPAERKFFVFMYFLANDQVKIYESNNKCNDSFPLFLGETKLRKNWKSFSSDLLDYYQPKDFIIGSYISVMGRRFMLYDCDPFTRDYYNHKLGIVQPDPIRVVEPKDNHLTHEEKAIPPYTGIGDPDDTMQNCLSLTPKPPKKVDFVRYVLNAGKKLRYKLKMSSVREEDRHRDFIMTFCLGNSQMAIQEMGNKNSGFIRGKFMAGVQLRKPHVNVDDNQQYYGPNDFAIGAEINVRGFTFIIAGLDLWTYNYMKDNSYMFNPEVIHGAKEYLEREGILKEQMMITGTNDKPRDVFC